jgi:hypothetical protein|tara:strand:+ start:36 stop:476 length:441 start_codon:yes stop_codon:yes gene_type:complete
MHYSYLYAFSNENEPGMKIGKSDNPKRRKAQFQTASSAPWVTELIIGAPIDVVYNLETKVHQILKPYHIIKGGGTEFFNVSRDALNMFKRMFLTFHTDCMDVTESNCFTNTVITHDDDEVVDRRYPTRFRCKPVDYWRNERKPTQV